MMKIVYILLVAFGGQTIETETFPFTVEGYKACTAKVQEYASASKRIAPVSATCGIRQETSETTN